MVASDRKKSEKGDYTLGNELVVSKQKQTCRAKEEKRQITDETFLIVHADHAMRRIESIKRRGDDDDNRKLIER